MNEHEYAGFWIRAWAAFIDSVLIAVITVPVLIAVYGDEYLSGDASVQGGWDLIISYLLPAVVVIVFWVYKSATPGKMIAKLAIVDAETGEEPSVGQFIGRYLGYYVSTIPLLLGILWVGFDKRKQGWHDKLAGTVVIRTNRYVDEHSDEIDIET